MLLYRVIIAVFILFAITPINAQNTRQHTVMRGETFSSIANKYGITEQQLKSANSAHSTCYVGLKLTIPAKEVAVNKKVVGANSPTETKPGTTATRQTNNAVSKNTYTKEDIKAAKKEKRRRFWEKFDKALANTSDALMAMADGFYKMGGNASSNPNYIPKTTSQVSQNITTKQSSNSNYTETIEKIGDGIFYVHQINSKAGTSSKSMYIRCMLCGGTTRCNDCQGKGVFRSIGRMERCFSCNGNGKCSHCLYEKYQGYSYTGMTVTDSKTGLTTNYDSKGNIITPNNTSSSSASSTTNSSSNQGSDTQYVICSSCNGTGLIYKETSCTIACDRIRCNTCGDIHCYRHGLHQKCTVCKGARQIRR